MIDFINHYKIKHADLPYLLTYLVIFFLILAIALLTMSMPTVILISICCLPILILLLVYHFYRANEELHIQQQKKLQAYFSLYNQIDFRLPPPFMTSWAATPELALSIYETIRVEKPENIVELGSGISSLLCAYAMEDNNRGTLLSLDHDKEYSAKTRTMLAQHSLTARVTVRHTPLTSIAIGEKSWRWYDCTETSLPESIDLLIVDGPPFETQENARYPALPLLADQLSDSATLIIHDAFRDDEKAIINRWLSEYPEFEKETIYSEKGIVILHRKATSG